MKLKEELRPADKVKELLATRRAMPQDKRALARRGEALFELAIADESAAQALVAESHRFVQYADKYVSEKTLEEFIRKYPQLCANLVRVSNRNNTIKCVLERVEAEEAEELPATVPLEDYDASATPPRETQPARTAMMRRHPMVQVSSTAEGDCVSVNATIYPCVTRRTRDFNRLLCSAGGSREREILTLNPDSPVLQEQYDLLRARVIQA